LVIVSAILVRELTGENRQVDNQINEILEVTLLISLNPTTWAIVIFLSIWARRIWIPAVSGVVVQIASLIPLAIYLNRIDEASVYDLLGGEGSTDIILLFSAPVLSGMMISALVIPLVRRRKKGREPASSA